MLDWVIRGGTVIDGSGGAPFRADIGIRSGKIAAVGSCGEAAKTLDAAGRYVTPGFLDIHRHGDAAVALAMAIHAREKLGSIEPWSCETVDVLAGQRFSFEGF